MSKSKEREPEPAGSSDKPKTPAKPGVSKGDFAAGERTMPPEPEGPDFARGERTLPASTDVGDFASGEHTLPTGANKDILEGKWHELKGQARQKFAKLTDDDIERLSGKMEEFSGVLQQKYGYTKAQADKAIYDWVKEANK